MLSLRRDPMTAGIGYMPVGLAVLASGLRERGHDPALVAAFGEVPDLLSWPCFCL